MACDICPQANLGLERSKTERLMVEINDLRRQLNEQRLQLEAVTDELRATHCESRSEKVGNSVLHGGL